MRQEGQDKRPPLSETHGPDQEEIGPPEGSQLIGRKLREADGSRWRVWRVDPKEGQAWLLPMGERPSVDKIRRIPLATLEARVRIAWEEAHPRPKAPKSQDRINRARRTSTSSRRAER